MHSNQSAIKLSKSPLSPLSTAGSSSARLFGLALLLSFIGSLPPGTTNLITLQMVADSGIGVALLFATGCLLAELVTVTASLFLVDRMIRFKGIMKFLQWISLFVLLALAMVSFIAAFGPSSSQVVPSWDGSSPLIFGFAMMIVNPVQLPFWLGWTTVMAERKILRSDGFHYVLYVAGSGLGSMLASLCFILLGKFLVSNWSIAPGAFHTTLGLLFFVSSVLQLRKILQPALPVRGKSMREIKDVVQTVA